MAWLIGILVFLLFIGMLIASPAFRIIVAIIVGLLGLSTYWLISNQQRRVEASRNAIEKEEVELRDVRLGSSYGSYKITGLVKNRSAQNTISRIALLVNVYDCPSKVLSKRCETIGEDNVNIFVSVPPAQVRSFDSYVSLHGLPKPRVFVWSYRLKGVRAAVP